MPSILTDRRIGAIAGWAMLGFVAGAAIGGAVLPKLTYYYPLAHQIPKLAGGASLRLAMVHDVLHDRFPRHGPAYYREQKRANKFVPEGIEDYCIALDALGEHQEAVRLMRLHLKDRTVRGDAGAKAYTTYANLGTILVHKALAQPDSSASREELREGIEFLKKAIEVQPDAHFGRAIWHVAFAEFQLAVLEDPKLALKFDMIGNRLEPRPAWMRGTMALHHPFGDMEKKMRHRGSITTVGAEEGWAAEAKLSVKERVPFDEPVLGIVGIWRQDGAHPYLAIALGNIMARVGQQNLAWCAYQRAQIEMDRFIADTFVRAGLVAFCMTQQVAMRVDEDVPPRFDAELKYGQDYQSEYQTFEEKQFGRGWLADGADFYKEFDEGRLPIATVPGREDFVAVDELQLLLILGFGLCGAGLLAMSSAWLITRKSTGA